MNNTFSTLGYLLVQSRSNTTASDISSFKPPSPRLTPPSRSTDLIPTEPTQNQSETPTWRTGSTVWGPGALTGKVLKWMGEGMVRGAERVAIQNKLSKFEKMQLDLLGSARNLTHDEERAIQDQCQKLVELCLIGMHYPSSIMTRAFKIVLSGFKLEIPGRQIWSYHIAEALSECDIMEVYEIFRDGFFTLLDDSIFRLKGLIDHETLCFRSPVVAHQIATIISHLAHKDRPLGAYSIRTPSSLSLTPSNSTVTESPLHLRPTFSRAIIEAGFFRLVQRWSERGLPHWDQPGLERLKLTLKDVADAQEFHGDIGSAEEAKELIQRLQDRRWMSDGEG